MQYPDPLFLSKKELFTYLYPQEKPTCSNRKYNRATKPQLVKAYTNRFLLNDEAIMADFEAIQAKYDMDDY